MKLDHFNISAPMDLLRQVRDFYVEVLGFEQGFRPAFTRRGFWLYADGKPCIHLIESEKHFAHDRPGYLDHIAFRSSDLALFRERLDRHNVPYRKSYIAEFEMTQLFFHDPAGTGLEINFPGES